MLIHDISLLLGCSETAIRNSLNSLKRSRLLKARKGKPVKLTKIGRIVAVAMIKNEKVMKE